MLEGSREPGKMQRASEQTSNERKRARSTNKAHEASGEVLRSSTEGLPAMMETAQRQQLECCYGNGKPPAGGDAAPGDRRLVTPQFPTHLTFRPDKRRLTTSHHGSGRTELTRFSCCQKGTNCVSCCRAGPGHPKTFQSHGLGCRVYTSVRPEGGPSGRARFGRARGGPRHEPTHRAEGGPVGYRAT